MIPSRSTQNMVYAAVTALLCAAGPLPADQPPADGDWSPRRVELLPLPGHQVAFSIQSQERTRWHFGGEYPRPFFYPLLGPGGVSLTRMGHPGAPNHDHHRSVWIAFHDVDGIDFWAEPPAGAGPQIRQKHWYAYRSSDEEAIMATRLGWFDADGLERIDQDLIAALRPMDGGQYALELQLDLRPGADVRRAATGTQSSAEVALGKTNFGFLAVRVAESLSAHFGGGRLVSSEGGEGELELFGRPARWVDYSGPVAVGAGPERRTQIEGITYFDHPDNPRYPTHWHVRSDGWMGAAFCLNEGYRLTEEEPLRLRYLLLVHSGPYDAATAERVHRSFAERPAMKVGKPEDGRPHLQFDVRRIALPVTDRAGPSVPD